MILSHFSNFLKRAKKVTYPMLFNIELTFNIKLMGQLQVPFGVIASKRGLFVQIMVSTM